MSEPAWMTNAYAELGLKEKDGALNEPKVVALFAEAGIPEIVDDATAWCGAFVTAMFARAGRRDVRPPGDRYNALRAREWLKVGRPTEDPQPGDIVVFSRGNSPTQGHVAFYVGQTDKSIQVLGGNQSNSVSVAFYPKSRLLGFRRVLQAQSAQPAPVQPKPPQPPVARPQSPAGPFRQPDDPGVEPGELAEVKPGFLERLLRLLGFRK